QVQQQLSGETLVVPQPSEVLLQGTSLGAARATSGSCRCDFDESSAQTSVSPPGIVAQAQSSQKLSPSQTERSPQNARKTSSPADSDSATSPISTHTRRTIAKTAEPTEQQTHCEKELLDETSRPFCRLTQENGLRRRRMQLAVLVPF